MFDVVKYMLPLAVGYAVGKAARVRPPSWLFTALVAVLVFAVSANASGAVLSNPGLYLAVSLVYSLALVLTSAVLGSVFDRRREGRGAGKPLVSLYAAASLAAGFAVGAFAKADYASAVEPLLIVLLFAAGVDMANAGVRLERAALLAPAVALAASALVGVFFKAALGITPAVAFGLGWYTFTGPYLARAGDAAGGAYGLLVNFFREQLTYLLGPHLARRFGRVGVLAAGGATTMDNTLPLYTALYGSSFSLYAFTNGVILTFIVPLLVPAVHQAFG